MNTPNFDVANASFSVQELSYLNLAWASRSVNDVFSINGVGSYRLAKVINDNGYDAAVVEKLNGAGNVTDAAYLNQGANGLNDMLEVVAVNGGSSSQAAKAAINYEQAALSYTDFTLKLSGHSMGGGFANYTLAKIIAGGGVIPETYTFAAQNAKELIDSTFNNSDQLAGNTSNFVTQNDYFFGVDGGFSSSFLASFANLTPNVSGEGFADQYVLPIWPGAGNESHAQVFIDIASASSSTGYDGLPIEVRGGMGSTTLWGNSAANVIYGNQGNDVLIGAGGADILWGGVGQDTFRFDKISDSGVALTDSIQDFVSGQDKIDVSAILAATVNSGSLSFVSSFTGQAGDAVLSYNQSSDQSSLAIDFSGAGVANFLVNIVGQAVASDVVA